MATDPNAGKPGYHYDAAKGLYVKDAPDDSGIGKTTSNLEFTDFVPDVVEDGLVDAANYGADSLDDFTGKTSAKEQKAKSDEIVGRFGATDLGAGSAASGDKAAGEFDKAAGIADTSAGQPTTYLQDLYAKETGTAPSAPSGVVYPPGGPISNNGPARDPNGPPPAPLPGGAPRRGSVTAPVADSSDTIPPPPPTPSKAPPPSSVVPTDSYLEGIIDQPPEIDPLTGLAKDRRDNGYGIDESIDSRTGTRLAGEGAPGFAEGGLGGVDAYADAPTGASDRAGARAGETGVLDPLLQKRLAGEDGPTTSEKYLNKIENSQPGRRADTLSSKLSDAKSTSENYLDFDPTDVYSKGAYLKMLGDSGPSSSEGFFDSMMSGENPALTRARDRLIKESDRAATARGGFNSGQTLRMQRDALSSLEADNIKYLGDLANQADTQKLGRQKGLIEGAGTVDTSVLGGRKVQGDIAANVDQFTGENTKVLAGLAQSGDEGEQEKDKVLASLAPKVDETITERRGQTDDVAGNAAADKTARLGQIDDLIKSSDKTEVEKEALRASVRQFVDTNKAATAADIDDFVAKTMGLKLEEGKQADLVTNMASEAKQAKDQLAYLVASGADSNQIQRAELALAEKEQTQKFALANKQFIADLAEKASQEKRGVQNEAFARAIAVASGRVGARAPFDLLASNQRFDQFMAQVEIELKASGIDTSFWGNAREETMTLINSYVSKK